MSAGLFTVRAFLECFSISKATVNKTISSQWTKSGIVVAAAQIQSIPIHKVNIMRI